MDGLASSLTPLKSTLCGQPFSSCSLPCKTASHYIQNKIQDLTSKTLHGQHPVCSSLTLLKMPQPQRPSFCPSKLIPFGLAFLSAGISCPQVIPWPALSHSGISLMTPPPRGLLYLTFCPVLSCHCLLHNTDHQLKLPYFFTPFSLFCIKKQGP